MTASSDASAGVRASNDDRERVASMLRQAAADGYLTLDEADERLAASYAARYQHELEPLTADLPHGGRRLYVSSPEGQAADSATRARVRRGLIRHAMLVAALAAVAITVWAISGASHFFPAPILFFGLLSLFLHARRVRWAGYGGYRGGPWGRRGGPWAYRGEPW